MAENNKITTRKRARPAVPIIQTLDHGKLPPQAIDLEEAILGALMIEPQHFQRINELLKPEVFYKETHQRIYSAILELSLESNPIDILTVTNKLKKRGELDLVGGPYYITQLTNRVASAANIEYHSFIIFQQFMKREQIRLGGNMISQAYDETVDVMDTNQEIAKMANYLLTSIEPSREKTNLQLIHEATKRTEEAKLMDGITGQKTGFGALDNLTCGWQNGDLIIIAARPSMGKTAFSLNMGKNMGVDFDQYGAFFTLEMTAIQLMNRLISCETGIELSKLQRGNLTPQDWTNYHKKITPLIDSKMTIVENIDNVHMIKSKMLDLHAKGKLNWCIIDYLQIAYNPDHPQNREREISSMSKMFKGLAKDLDIPVIVLSQLSREVEKRATKKPQLSDLRESGSIEQDADVIMFLFRGEYYNMANAVKGQALGMVKKHRNGSLDTIKFNFNAPTVTFKDWEEPAKADKIEDGQEGLPFR